MNSAIAFVLPFLNGLVGVFVAGLIALFVARCFTSERGARISAFSFALGIAIAKFSFSGPASLETALAATRAVGAVAALGGLWMWLLRGTDASAERSD